MDYLTAWREGHKEGVNLVVSEINKHCDMEFKSFADLIRYINEAKEQLIVKHLYEESP
jgi:hypothetical protein